MGTITSIGAKNQQTDLLNLRPGDLKQSLAPEDLWADVRPEDSNPRKLNMDDFYLDMGALIQKFYQESLWRI